MPASPSRLLPVLAVLSLALHLGACVQCDENEVQRNNRCVRLCNVDADCPGDQHCETGECRPGAPETGSGGSSSLGSGSSSAASGSSTAGSSSLSSSSSSGGAAATSTSSGVGTGVSSGSSSGSASSTASGSSGTVSSSSSASSSASSASSSSSGGLLEIADMTPTTALQWDGPVVLRVALRQASADCAITWNNTALPTEDVGERNYQAELSNVELAGAGSVAVSMRCGTQQAETRLFIVRPTPAATTWHLASGYTAEGWSTLLDITNPTSEPTGVTLTYYTDLANMQVIRDVAVPARTHLSLDLADASVGPNTTYPFATRVTTEQVPVVVSLRTLHAGNAVGHGTVGSRNASTRHLFATGANTSQTTTYVSILNRSGMTASLTLYQRVGSATTIEQQDTVPDGVQVEWGVVPTEAVAWLEVISDVPVYAQVQEVGSGYSLELPSEATGSAYQVIASSSTAYGFEADLRIANPSDVSSSEVTVTYLPITGSPTTETVTVLPRAVAVLTASTHVNDPVSDFWAELVATEPVVASVKLHRAGEDVTAHVARGTPATDLMFPGGSTVYPWVTYVDVTNPQDVPADVELRIFPASEPARQHTFTLAPRTLDSINVIDDVGVVAQQFGVVVNASVPVAGYLFVFNVDDGTTVGLEAIYP
ncbi:MAG: DUF5719 family protein [Myxococcota bacterium]